VFEIVPGAPGDCLLLFSGFPKEFCGNYEFLFGKLIFPFPVFEGKVVEGVPFPVFFPVGKVLGS